jgi:hypothetical protein
MRLRIASIFYFGAFLLGIAVGWGTISAIDQHHADWICTTINIVVCAAWSTVVWVKMRQEKSA